MTTNPVPGVERLCIVPARQRGLEIAALAILLVVVTLQQIQLSHYRAIAARVAVTDTYAHDPGKLMQAQAGEARLP